MSKRRVWWCLVWAAVGWLLPIAPASAQGLLWSLPEDGTWVRYYGTTKNVQERPESSEGALELSWLSELTIKSVGKETAEYRGAPTECRWIEFKLVNGYQSAAGISPGPYGTRIYKVLVPESRVLGKLVDGDDIPATFIPIIKGYRKLGEQEAQPVKEKVLAVYPILSLFAYYKNFAPAGDGMEDVDLPQLGSVPAKAYKGSKTLEGPVSRSVNEGEIWLSSEVPFGWAKYHVKVVREEKESAAPPDEYKKTAELDVTMEAVEKGTDAQSEIGDVAETKPEAAAADENAAEKPGNE
jgi:hypothetical protein